MTRACAHKVVCLARPSECRSRPVSDCRWDPAADARGLLRLPAVAEILRAVRRVAVLLLLLREGRMVSGLPGQGGKGIVAHPLAAQMAAGCPPLPVDTLVRRIAVVRRSDARLKAELPVW